MPVITKRLTAFTHPGQAGLPGLRLRLRLRLSVSLSLYSQSSLSGQGRMEGRNEGDEDGARERGQTETGEGGRVCSAA